MNRPHPLRKALFVALLFVPAALALAQPPYVGAKREFRGVWIATVTNYDWPRSPFMSTQHQQDSLRVLLDDIAKAGYNAVVFQVRPECDALYASAYEPWSYWLTGTQGLAPSPLYDPLEFAVGEARKRGLEIHAWFNPYRAYRESNTYPTSALHVTNQHPEWVLVCPDGYRFLDPGLPMVRDHVARVITDVVHRYDIDAVHFDDYFYPYSEHQFTKQDSVTWATYPRGFTWDSLASWRRDNVNLLVHQVYDSIQQVKPWVKFGISPFGIWKNNVPSGVSGTSAYDLLYCDATAWLKGQYVDYIVPQLYWAFGGGQDYGLLQPWWGSERNGRHFYSGNAIYRIAQSGWSPLEITAQIRHNQTHHNNQGSVHFRAYNIRTNDGGIVNVLKGDVFRYPSLVPVMEWKETTPPNVPSNVQFAYDGGSGRYRLAWDPPPAAADGDTAVRYVVYRYRIGSPAPGDNDLPRNIIALVGSTECVPGPRIDLSDAQYHYAVSALDKNNNESSVTAPATIPGPLAAPVPALPIDGEMNYANGSAITWHPVPGATLYRFDLDTSGTFVDGQLLLTVQTTDTFTIPGGLAGQKQYYWRVTAGSQLGESPLSAVRWFRTGWPVPPVLVSPFGRGIVRNPTFLWRNSGGTTYELQVFDYVTLDTVIHVTVTDTTYKSTALLTASRNHTWKVKASNAYGGSSWSALGSFQTGTSVSDVSESELPDRFALLQNFPNPFNPTTVVSYQLPVASEVKLVVYDVLGREVAVLVNEKKSPGRYQAPFDAAGLASGVYLYRLHAGNFIQTKSMLLLR